MIIFCSYLSPSLTACLWYRTVRLTEVTRTAATLTSQPCIACPSGIFTRRPFSFAPRSTTSISENDIRSSYPDAVGIPDTIISSTSFSAFRASFLRLVSSKRSSEDDTCLLANDSRNCTRNEVSQEFPATTDNQIGAITYHLQLILPKLLLAGLIEERELAHMVHKDVSQNRQFRINGGNFPKFRFEGSAEAVEGSRGVQLVDFVTYLTGDQLALQICTG